jgi:hypothetical protein
VAKFRLSYDGRWQERFDDEARALEFGRELGEATGRLVYVVRQGVFRPKLLAVFPESCTELGEQMWRARAAGANLGGGGGS